MAEIGDGLGGPSGHAQNLAAAEPDIRLFRDDGNQLRCVVRGTLHIAGKDRAGRRQEKQFRFLGGVGKEAIEDGEGGVHLELRVQNQGVAEEGIQSVGRQRHTAGKSVFGILLVAKTGRGFAQHLQGRHIVWRAVQVALEKCDRGGKPVRPQGIDGGLQIGRGSAKMFGAGRGGGCGVACEEQVIAEGCPGARHIAPQICGVAQGRECCFAFALAGKGKAEFVEGVGGARVCGGESFEQAARGRGIALAPPGGGDDEKGAGVIPKEFQDFPGLALGARRVAFQQGHRMFNRPRGRNALCHSRLPPFHTLPRNIIARRRARGPFAC